MNFFLSVSWAILKFREWLRLYNNTLLSGKFAARPDVEIVTLGSKVYSYSYE